jgi:hypothetical protein
LNTVRANSPSIAAHHGDSVFVANHDEAVALLVKVESYQRPYQMTAWVKVFGCRPWLAEHEARGRRTETAQARTRGAQVRGYGDLKILAGSRGDCEKQFTRGSWR